MPHILVHPGTVQHGVLCTSVLFFAPYGAMYQVLFQSDDASSESNCNKNFRGQPSG